MRHLSVSFSRTLITYNLIFLLFKIYRILLTIPRRFVDIHEVCQVVLGGCLSVTVGV